MIAGDHAMRVKIGDTWFEPTADVPIMAELSDVDKENISDMEPGANRYAVFSQDCKMGEPVKIKWMDDGARPVQDTLSGRICAPRRGAATMTNSDTDALVTLNDCPPGLFWFNGTLGFKSEYKSATANGDWQVDAYVVASGEYFWGGARNSPERGKLLVTPARAGERLP